MMRVPSLIRTFFLFGICSVFFYKGINAQTATLESSLSLVDINGAKVPYQNGMPLPAFEKQSSRILLDLAGTWKKQRFSANHDLSLTKRNSSAIASLESEAAGRQTPSLDDSGWENKTLPGVENTLHNTNTPPEFYNDGIWYRKQFQISDSLNGKFVKLIFYSVNYVCDVWINGNYIGYHEGGYTPFAFDVSPYLKYGQSNTIAVRVDNIPWSTRNDIVPYTTPDWFNYAGIIHDVYLEVSDKISVARANIVPQNTDGDIETTVVLNNESDSAREITADIKIYEAAISETNIQSEYAEDLIGNEVAFSGSGEKNLTIEAGAANVWKTNLKIPDPKLWSMKSPQLYIMKVTLKSGSEITDEYYTQFGIRKVEVRDSRFVLNNRIWFLVGTARHEEHPDYGRSVPKEIIYSDLNMIKDLRVLYLRTAHYPNHPYTYLIADRIGLAVMEEIPVYWFDSADAWKIQNEQRKIHIQMFREMVFRDFNRPSIVMWSASNECLDVPNRKLYHQMLVADRLAYSDGRLLTESAAADRPGPYDDSQTPLDAAGWTMYFGIFHKYQLSQPKLTEAFGGTFNFLNNAKASFPTKPIIATEFGYWSSEDNSKTSDQTYIFNETFKAFKIHAPYSESGTEQTYGNLFGVTWWCAFDWYQYRTGGWQTMGLISMDRQTYKPVANALKIAYTPYFNREGLVVDVNDESGSMPSGFELEQNFPNPFNPETTIKYSIPSNVVERLHPAWAGQVGASLRMVTLKIYDILGREVARLVNENKSPGNYEVKFNGANLPSGIYLYRLKSGNFTTSKKMILLK